MTKWAALNWTGCIAPWWWNRKTTPGFASLQAIEEEVLWGIVILGVWPWWWNLNVVAATKSPNPEWLRPSLSGVSRFRNGSFPCLSVSLWLSLSFLYFCETTVGQTPNLFSDVWFQDENIAWAGRAWGRTSWHIPLVPDVWMCAGVGTSLGSEPPNSFSFTPSAGYWTSVVRARWARSTQRYWSLALSFCKCMWVVCACLCMCVCMYVGCCHLSSPLSNLLGRKVNNPIAGVGVSLGYVVGKPTLVHQTLDHSECQPRPQKSGFWSPYL